MADEHDNTSPEEQALADEWAAALAEAGDGEAQLALAGLYMQGVGVGRDPARAAQWYLRAARQGLVMAQLNLGDLHARGLGVRRDPVQAYRWLELAARQNHAWARNRRDQLAGAMTPAQIDEARRLADGFRAETGSSR